MVSYRSCALNAILISGTALLSSNAFVSNASFGAQTRLHESNTEFELDDRTGKRTGNSFLSEETIERALKGNPIEKMKQKKDATAAFVDVYEYAAKIRSGEMNWDDVERADLDNVSAFHHILFHSVVLESEKISLMRLSSINSNSALNMLECCTETNEPQDNS